VTFAFLRSPALRYSKIDRSTSLPVRTKSCETIRIALWFLSSVFLTVTSCFIPPAAAQSLDRPDLIRSFPVGDGPAYLAFDGANIWTSNFYGGTLTRLRASDGAPKAPSPLGRRADN
jgi:hypothetical protein